MATTEVVVIDSSEDESDESHAPKKKIKLDCSDGDDEEYLSGIKIKNITSLASMPANERDSFNSDVVLIDDENNSNDSIKNSKDSPDSNAADKENGVHSEQEVANKDQSLPDEFEKFLSVSLSTSVATKYRDLLLSKMDKIKDKYAAAEPEFVKSSSFVEMLARKCELMQQRPADVCIHFNDVYQELRARARVQQVGEADGADKEQLSARRHRHLRRLCKTLEQLGHKIRELEQSEVDWSDESAYVREERYKQRFVQVHRMLCRLTQENEYANRATHRRLDFSASQHPEVNRCIDRLYSRLRSFPTYQDVDEAMRACVREHALPLAGPTLQAEVGRIFEALGKLLKRRRQHELEDSHFYFLTEENDPAEQDPQLEGRLHQQYREGQQRIDQLMQRFTERQENGEDAEDTAASNSGSGSDDDSDSERPTSDGEDAPAPAPAAH